METQETDGVRYLTPQEVSARTGLALQTLANWRSTWPHGERKGPQWIKPAGHIGSPGGRVLYPAEDLERYLAERGPAAAVPAA